MASAAADALGASSLEGLPHAHAHADALPIPVSSDETPTASSEVASAGLSPPPSPPSAPARNETDAFPDLPLPPPPPPPPRHTLPSSRSGRSLSLAQLSGPVKRKPLSSTASPAAVRFSKGAAAYANILADLPRPEQRFARSCSLDSPTLYEFPDHRSFLETSSLNTVVDSPESPSSSRPYVSSLLTQISPAVVSSG